MYALYSERAHRLQVLRVLLVGGEDSPRLPHFWYSVSTRGIHYFRPYGRIRGGISEVYEREGCFSATGTSSRLIVRGSRGGVVWLLRETIMRISWSYICAYGVWMMAGDLLSAYCRA